MSEKCCICEGRIVDGRCVECGMPVAKSTNRYHLNENRSVHEKECISEKERKKNQTGTTDTWDYQSMKELQEKTVKKVASVPRSYHYQKQEWKSKEKSAGKERKPKTKNNKWILIVLIVMGIMAFGAYMDYRSEQEEKAYSRIWEGEVQEEVAYDMVVREIPDTGEVFHTEMEAGMYIVGCQLPEGIYKATGTGNVRIRITDSENLIYLDYDFSEDEDALVLDDIWLYQDAQIIVDGDGKILLETENAQNDMRYEAVPNENQQVIRLMGDQSRYMAGFNIPVGFYHVKAVGGEVSFSYEPVDQDMGNSYFTVSEQSDYGYPWQIKHLLLKDGDILEIQSSYDGAFLSLEPSEYTYNEVLEK